MSLRALTKNKQGFTIIEVMIVLAIAGLIVLVVFLAVPALQRNSRNTQRKQDAQSLLAGIQEWISLNGSNEVPNTTARAKAIVDSTGLGYYNPGDVYIDTISVTATGPLVPLADATTAIPNPKPDDMFSPNHDTQDNIYIWTGANCHTTATPERADGSGPSRSIAIEFAVETADGSQIECRAF